MAIRPLLCALFRAVDRARHGHMCNVATSVTAAARTALHAAVPPVSHASGHRTRAASMSSAPAAAFTVVRAHLSTPAHAAAWRAATQAYANDPMGGSQTLSEEVLSRNVAALATWPTSVVFLAMTAGEQPEVAGMATCFRGWGTFQARAASAPAPTCAARRRGGRWPPAHAASRAGQVGS